MKEVSKNAVAASWKKVNTAAERITLAAGLEAWAGLNVDQTPKAIAVRYNVDVDTVLRSKAATAELHHKLAALFGTEYYFEEMDFERFIGLAIARADMAAAA